MIINRHFDPLVFESPWMIDQSAMDTLIARIRNADFSDDAAAFRRAPERADRQTPYELRGDTAVIRVTGALTKEPGIFSYLFSGLGARTYDDVIRLADAADNDPRVKKKVLKLNTPGGTVAGAFEAAHFLAKSGEKKPIYAYVDGQMTSAGLLLGAPAKQIAAPKTAQVGSIGVIWAHINEEKLNEQIGIEVTYLTAGKYKKFGNPDEPLSKEAEAYFQDRLDRTYSFFVDDVARYRNMLTEAVLKAADGRVFLAEQGLEAGLVDTIVNDFEEFLETLKTEDRSMDLNELKTQHPDLYARVMEEGRKEGRQAAEAEAPDPKAAATEAADRVLSIVKVVAGEETAGQVKQIADTGMTAEQLDAVKGLFAKPEEKPSQAEGTENPSPSRQQILDGLNAAGNQPLNSGGGAGAASGQEVDFLAEVEQHKKANPNDTHFQAIQAVRRIHPQAYEKWIEAENRR
jgi:signal peptide peptidase SppA